MYFLLLFLHSLFRWLLLLALLSSIVIAYRGMRSGSTFTKTANRFRHWTATIAHVQLSLGLAIYVQSPIVKMSIDSDQLVNSHTFFKYIHVFFMAAAVIVLTIGSAKAKRIEADIEKYKVMLVWFLAALVIIMIFIPWPFSPLSSRPLFRFLH